MKKFSFATLLLICGATAFAQAPVRIGWLQEGVSEAEKTALQQFFDSRKNQFSIFPLTAGQINSGELSRTKCTHVFYHRTDETDPAAALGSLKDTLRNFVEKGGNLILTMEGVRLLDDWGFETAAPEIRTDTIRDEGYGRPLGFHGFKSHPIFDGLHGGAVVWKSPEDHLLRKIGYFGAESRPQGKVAGIDWAYITFKENDKLVLEYAQGKGKVIAVGAYLYFSKPNANRLHLEKFTENLFRYTAGQLSNIPARFWSYISKPEITPLEKPLPAVKPVRGKKWTQPAPSLTLKGSGSKDFFDLSGRRMTVMGKEKGGIDEIWAHPFMALRDYKLGLVSASNGYVTWLNTMTPAVLITPEAIIRYYNFEGFQVKEIITVSQDEPAAVFHYEMNGDSALKVIVNFASDMRYMWPYSSNATGNMSYGASADFQGMVLTAQDGDLCTVMGFSEPFREIANIDHNPHPQDSFSVIRRFETTIDPAVGALDIRVVAGSEGWLKTVDFYSKNIGNFENILTRSNAYYKNLLANRLIIETPDTAFNEAYQWALVRTDQCFIETPGVGASLMAGLGTTDQGWDGNQPVSGRPGYAWYFGRDGAWSGLAMNASGDTAGVRKMLDMFVRYQDPSGKIFHELTSSGAVHYDAADATPLFVVLAGHYLRYSGNLPYIRSIWPAVLRAMDFMYTTDTDGDGLIENTNVGHGWIEGGRLYGSHTEFYLAGCWVAALENAAYMAGLLNDPRATKYEQDQKSIGKYVDSEFWNPQTNFYSNGKMADETYMEDATVLACVPVYFGLTGDTARQAAVARRFNDNDFTTDWGVRMVGASNSWYNPEGYHSGSVWPLFGGWASLAAFRTGMVTNAFDHCQRNGLVYRHWGLGSVEEVLHGDIYTPKGVCHHQCWSETMVLLPALEGMIGLQPDAYRRRLGMKLRLPWHWDSVKLKNIRVGDVVFDMDIDRIEGKTFYTFKAQGKPQLMLDIEVEFAPASVLTEVESFAQPSGFTETNEGTTVVLPNVPLKPGETIAIACEGGIGILPQTANIWGIEPGPKPGDRSSGFRFVDQSNSIDDRYYTATFEGFSGSTNRAFLFSQSGFKEIQNAKVIEQRGTIYEIEVTIPPVNGQFGRQMVKVSW